MKPVAAWTACRRTCSPSSSARSREKRAAGVDVISLGIGDPDTPTPAPVVEALGRAARRPGHPPVPVEPRPAGAARGVRPLLRAPLRRDARPGDARSCPALGAKECVFNLNLAFLDPGDVALAADPGYPVYTGGPLLAGAEAVLMPLLPERGFAPDLDAIGGDVARARAADVPQLPEQPDRRGGARRAVRARRSSSRASTTCWSCTTPPTPRPPSTATWRRASSRRRGRRRWASRCSRSRRAGT